ncbi:MAG: glycosyltransferase family 39 protein [Deltaproteobacteria bacterium]|nr:glycosyltransferase family 39 protein [Deltaproteobacteria bacterium]
MVWFDSVHYTISAKTFLQTGHFWIPINEMMHPSGKSPGFSLFLAPLYFFFTDNLGTAVWVPFLSGLGSLFVFYLFAKKCGGRETALFAFLLLALSPLHITYSKLIMPSIIPLFLILAGSLLLIHSRKNSFLFFAGLLFGLSAITRYLTIAIFPATVAYLLLQITEPFRERLKKTAALGLGIAIPLAWLLWHQWSAFGSPWITDYDYWNHFHPNIQKPFSLAYGFLVPPTSGGSPNILFNLVSATGAYIPYPNILTSRPDQLLLALLLWSLAWIGFVHFYHINRPLFYFLLTAVAGYYFSHAFLFSQTAHFMLPVVPFVLLAAASGCHACMEKLSPRKTALLYSFCLVGLVSFLPFAYSFSHPPFKPEQQEYLQMIRQNLPEHSVLISDYEAALFTEEVGQKKKITLMAISPVTVYADRQRYLKGQTLPPAIEAATKNLEKIGGWLAEKRPVYLALLNAAQYQSELEKLADNFILEPTTDSVKHFRLFRLQPFSKNRALPSDFE